MLVDAAVATEAVHATVDAAAVEVSPPAVAAATALDVHVVGGGEAVVRRAVAAAAAAVPVQVVAEAVAGTVTAAACVVETAKAVGVLIEDLDARASLNLEPLKALIYERRSRLRKGPVAAKVVIEDFDPSGLLLLAERF